MKLSRRNVLQGLTTGLFAPLFLEAAAQTVVPARLVIVMECNGIYPVTLLSNAARAAVGTGVGTRRNFSNLYRSSAQVLTDSGLASGLSTTSLGAPGAQASIENRAAVVLGLSNTIAGGGHSTNSGALSCAPSGTAATFDAVISPRLKRSAPFEAIRLGTSAATAPLAYQSCNFGPRRPAGIMVNPALAYETVFGAMLGGAGAGRERGELFDFAREDVSRALSTFKGNSNERLKLERYLTSLDALRGRDAMLQTLAPGFAGLLPPAPADNPLLQGTGGKPDSLLWLQAQFQIATAALLGGLTNTVVLASGTSGFDVNYESVIAGIDRHKLQHGIEVPANWAAIATVTARHVELVATLARTLAATPEVGASGSMLDHTAIVYLSDNGEQHHSTAREWPMLLVGGNALGLKTDGRTVIFPAEGSANNRQVSNLFNTLGHAMGDASFDTFGSEAANRIAPGPLSELF